MTAHKIARASPPAVRLLDKNEVCATAGASYPTIWQWQQNGTFPRGLIVGGKTKWRSDEIEQWLADLPVRRLKGDPTPEAAA
jgi:predicted DNA-binding transcriptional regulator AlpA